MMSLFSSFDLYFSPYSIIFLTMFFINFFTKVYNVSYISAALIYISNGLETFFLTLNPGYFNNNFCILYVSTFFIVFLLNFTSVISFNFPTTSQVSTVLLLGLTTWLSYNIFFNYNCWNGFLSHCIPEGTPIYLVWFLFMIEVISSIIRPITITVRLVANILAGHLLLILLSKLVFLFPASTVSYVILNVLEFVVSLIQAYIFTTMLVLYYSDVK